MASSGGGGGGGGAVSLLGLLTGNTPRKLQESAQQHEMRLMERAAELHNKAAKELQADEAFQKYAESKGLNPDQRHSLAVDILNKNREYQATSEGAAELDPDVINSYKRKRIAENLLPEVMNSRNLTVTTPENAFTSQPKVPGVNTDAMQIQGPLRGGTELKPSKFLPNPKNGQLIPYEYSQVTQGASPGRMSSGVSPELHSKIVGNTGMGGPTPAGTPNPLSVADPGMLPMIGAGNPNIQPNVGTPPLSGTPPDDRAPYVAPAPAKAQSSNGQLIPQGGFRGGLLPDAIHGIMQGGADIYDSYMRYLANPLNRLLLGPNAVRQMPEIPPQLPY